MASEDLSAQSYRIFYDTFMKLKSLSYSSGGGGGATCTVSFCVPQEKENHTGLKWHDDRILIRGWTILLRERERYLWKMYTQPTWSWLLYVIIKDVLSSVSSRARKKLQRTSFFSNQNTLSANYLTSHYIHRRHAFPLTLRQEQNKSLYFYLCVQLKLFKHFLFHNPRS